MKTSALVSLCIAAVATANFVAFPDNLSCITNTGTKIITRAQLENAVENNPRSLIEQVASNMATGPSCSGLRDPLYAVNFPEIESIHFVFKESTGTYTFCGGQGVDRENIGYPSICQAV